MADTDAILATEEGRLLPRLEKKSRQTLAKLGLRKVEGINRVVLRRPQGVSCLYLYALRPRLVITPAFAVHNYFEKTCGNSSA